jgi:amidophosphoribosyltransferase
VFEDKPHHECGIFGIFAPDEDVARMTFFGLYALQHRGQESAGIAVADGRSINMHKDMGLVSQVFTEESLKPLTGHVAIGHNRYSTTGSSKLLNAQPFLVQSALGPLAIGHNGNLTNGNSLRNELFERGFGLSSTSDSEVIVQMLAGGRGNTWDARINSFMTRAEGAYCLTIMTKDTLYAVRDPWGVHPLCIGQFGKGWVVASESCALATIGATFVRELDPGEVIAIDHNGLRTIGQHAAKGRSLCLFEYIYFARPDSQIDGHTLHASRVLAGQILAKESPVDADVVIPVPDSGIPAAIGYAQASGIP